MPTVPASAEVGVEPAPWSPRIHIRAERGASPQASTPVKGEPTKADPVKRYLQCTESGTSCGDSFETLPGAPPEDDDEPELTTGDILRAVREIGLPSLQLKIQPGEETLVNIETIFYTEPRAFEHSIDLLGFDIDLSASPVRYRWVHDDGMVSTTSKPGRPYPAMDVTHRYRKPDAVRPRVDVTYRVRYRIDGGAWQTIGQTLRASGPAVGLEVREAAPVLARP